MICIILSSILVIFSPQSTSISIKHFLSEVMDQRQERDDGSMPIQYMEWQEFTPVAKKILRVEVKIKSTVGETTLIRLSIEQPLGTVLSSKELPSSEIPNTPDWVSFDIPDIKLNPGKIYYIVLSTSPNSYYSWCGASNNPYTNGVSSRGSDWDWCFRTYVDKSISKFLTPISEKSPHFSLRDEPRILFFETYIFTLGQARSPTAGL